MLLGIGTSGPQVAEGWHGQRFGKQLQRTREYVEILRQALAASSRTRRDLPAAAAGRAGKALKLTIAPVQERIPIYIASIGPKNTQLTGEIADGWLPIFFSRSTWTSRASCSRRAPPGPGARWGRSSTSRPA